ncbi:MAG: M23 family metallopeptidase [Spirochaetales bacterium]
MGPNESSTQSTPHRNSVTRGVSRIRAGLNAGARTARRLLRRRFTVMIVPHSAKSPLNFTIGFLGLVFSAVLLVAVAGSSVWMIRDGVNRLQELNQREDELYRLQASVDSLRDDIAGLFSSARNFDSALKSVLGHIPGKAAGSDEAVYEGVLESESGGPGAEDLDVLQRLSSLLSSAGKPLNEVAQAVDSKEQLFDEIPIDWPVGGGIGVVTHEWGPNIHPFYGRWYMHTGIDIAHHGSSIPLVATADGTVVETGNREFGYGLYVDIEHRYGIRTKHAHLSRIDVSEGDEVKQGDTIGLLGSTGMSTGPHVHYEIIVGGRNVDPSGYLTIDNDFRRRTTRRLR